ncbi:Elicitor peptide 5 [Arabidopsis thaliana]
MQQERDHKRDCCKLMPQTVKAFFKCLRFRRSSSSSSDMVKARARNVKTDHSEEKEEPSSIETSTRSLNVMRKGIRKQPVSSGKRGGVNDYDM